MTIRIPLLGERKPSGPAPVAQPVTQQAPPREAFGAGVAQADVRVGQEVAKLGGVIAQRVLERQRMRDSQEVAKIDTQFRLRIQESLYSEEQDKDGTPRGVLNRRGENAEGVTSRFDESFTSARDEFLEAAQNNDQYNALLQRMESHYGSVRGSVIKHETNQGEIAFKDAQDANMKQRVLDAADITDPDALVATIEEAQVDVANALTTLQKTDAEKTLAMALIASDIAKSSIASAVANDPDLAQYLLDGVKTVLPKGVITSLQGAIDGKLIEERQARAWDSFTATDALKLPDGNWDLEQMRSAIMGDDPSREFAELDQSTRVRIWNYIKARANEDLVFRTRHQASVDRQFMNEALQARSSKVPLDQALKIAAKYNTDAYDLALKVEKIKKINAPPTTSDKQTYLSLWQRVINGNGNKREIDAAFKMGLLTNSDHESLWKDQVLMLTDGKSPEVKATWDRIRGHAKSKYGSGTTYYDFMYEMHVSGRGMNPNELWEMVNNKLKTAPDRWFEKRWKVDLARGDVDRLALGKAAEAVGRDELNAIGMGILQSDPEKREWTAADIDSFANEFGSYQDIKKGTQVNNAIRALMLGGKAVTVQNVKTVLERIQSGRAGE